MCLADPKKRKELQDAVRPVGEVRADLSSAEIIGDRGSSWKVYRQVDGSKRFKFWSAPVHAPDGGGGWRDVNPTVRSEGDRLVADGGGFTAGFAKAASAPSLMSVSSGSSVVSFGLEGAKAVAPTFLANTVRYSGVFPQTDLVFETTPTGVKEDVVLLNRAAPTTFRFPLAVPSGGSARIVDEAIVVAGPDGAVLGSFHAPLVSDAAGAVLRGKIFGGATRPIDVRFGMGLDVSKPASPVMVVSVDPAWVNEKDRVFPVAIDPTYIFLSFALQGTGVADTWVGSAAPNTTHDIDTRTYIGAKDGGLARGYIHINVNALLGKTIQKAEMQLAAMAWNTYPGDPVSVRAERVVPIGAYNQPSVTWATQSATDVGNGAVLLPTAASTLRGDVTGIVKKWANDGAPIAGIAMKVVNQNGVETTERFVELNAFDGPVLSWAPPVLEVVAIDTPLMAAIGQPASPISGTATKPVTIATLAPNLTITPGQFPGGSSAGVQYWYRVATGPSMAGVVWSSGWSTNLGAQVPLGTLRDGQVYWWQVWTRTSSEVIGWQDSKIEKFKVDLHLGAEGVAAFDGIGSATANLANGNFVLTAPTRSIDTASGPIGFSMTYNSQQKRRTGLVGTYTWTGMVPSPIVVRDDAAVNFFWGSGNPAGVIRPDDFSVTWRGFITVPTTGSWKFGTISDDTSSVTINGNLVATNAGCCQEVLSAPVGMTLGVPVPIRVDYAELTGSASIALRAQGPNGQSVDVPADWLTPNDDPLPTGWTLSAGSSGLAWRAIDMSAAGNGDATGGVSAVLVDASGERHSFAAVKGSVSSFEGPAGSTATLTRNSDGTWTLMDSDTTIEFDNGGRPIRVRDGSDDLNSGGWLNYTYGGAPTRLVQVSDSVSGRAVTLHYGGINDAGVCSQGPGGGWGMDAAFSALPAGKLCGIAWPDGTKTTLHYSPAGQVSWVVDLTNGGANGLTDKIWGFGFTGSQMVSLLAPDQMNMYWAGAQSVDTVMTYDANGRVASITGPATAAGREVHTMNYAPAGQPFGTVDVSVAGLSQPAGYARRVMIDPATARLLSSTGTDGVTTSYTWSGSDELLATTVGGTYKSTTEYDAMSRPIASYGPAQASCFGAAAVPTGCAGLVPTSLAAYDENLSGLAATWWNTPSPGVVNGAPVRHSHFRGTNGLFTVNLGAGSPVSGVNADGFVGRMTGAINLPAGTVEFRFAAQDDGARLFVDDELIIDSWLVGAFTSNTGTVLNKPGLRKIRVDYLEWTGSASLELHYRVNGGGWVVVPMSMLTPLYGHATTSQTVDGSPGSPTLMTQTIVSDGTLVGVNGQLVPFGQTEAVVVNPGGGVNELRTRYGYTPQGSRVVVSQRQQPGGNSWAYEYYGPTEAATACIGAVTHQGGLLKRKTHPGGLISEEFSYDLSGHEVGYRKYKTASVSDVTNFPWTCSSFDHRDRPKQQAVAGVVSNPDAPARYEDVFVCG